VATRLLLELSRGQYSLSFDNRRNEFGVVDHANADEPRLARTLSGGETFLASLALALALSEQVTRLAARGGARLDAIFLDEGFGTLDADTLDTVAAAIEELGARGHVVGLVTHVPELAERVPVRFEVTKDPRGSRVVRVDG
jgi:exonuclease SbcC